ncbi:MAG: hypothetical protein A2464_07730 [Deltaproteobacteria bacterium RIFOXYC2_FULL_48_10]|nr:MAG: hypothetical protein A2464_07730 [Deltaproteobacteria bacterium RIFOXYC2_FULL_48_10]
MDIRIGIEFSVSILFGLEISIITLIAFIKETFMENSIMLFACIWCGVAFLRGLGGTLPTQMRD